MTYDRFVRRFTRVPVDPVIDAQVEALQARPRNHIFHNCDVTVMFCGARLSPPTSNEIVNAMPDGDECVDCYLVWLGGYCPICGAHWTMEDYRARGL